MIFRWTFIASVGLWLSLGGFFVARGDSVDAFDVPSALVSEPLIATSDMALLATPSSSCKLEPSSAAFASASWMQAMENAEMKQLSQDRQAIRNELVERAEQWLRFQERSGKSPIVSISWVVSGFLRLGFEPTDPFLAPLTARLCELAKLNDLTVSKESKSEETETSKSSTLSAEECGAIRNCLTVLEECDAQKSNTVRVSKTSCERNRTKAHDERHTEACEAENAALLRTEFRAKLLERSVSVTSVISSRASLPSPNTPSIVPSRISPIVLAMATRLDDTTLTDGAEMQTRLQRVTQFLRCGWTIPTEQESRVSLAVMGTYSEKEAVTTSFAEIRTLSCWCADTIRLTLHDRRSTPLIPNEPSDTPISAPLWIGMTGTSTVSSRPVLPLCAIASCESNTDWDRILRANSQILSTSYVTMIQTTLRRE